MAPLPKHCGRPPKPWNRIYVADVLDAIDPLICIRCLGHKDQPGVNTICSACQAFFDLDRNSAERFLFFTCLRIFDFSLWVRRKILSDVFVLKDDENGTLVEHHMGAPGDKQDLPSLRAVRRPDQEDGEDGEIVLLSSMGTELLEEALLTSRQCDVVLVLLVDIMKSELLQGECCLHSELMAPDSVC
ncbi:hypothetical protein BU25DRAFT_238404 [Macroventuria anomochaeta]|uniref:Uncharacterized protein n=1 Tax=Macroventuria anomochaeta TaxID=301207 RepID=A0ACB6RJS6_9PLEO|nr:uncharacterized protein BU25DRAFT_238404 [Macroventuria anomochaeta]KAF2621353.1 hypothetical protein BU25DRAFT_238404 [Macroventuria anomochaeta]